MLLRPFAGFRRFAAEIVARRQQLIALSLIAGCIVTLDQLGVSRVVAIQQAFTPGLIAPRVATLGLLALALLGLEPLGEG